jgi:3,4-dihydroxy-9,10-secoandrosta-1,3,5(10)-triene-9,17-dione 4,5-dioxygenase
MEVRGLGYVGVTAPDPAEWARFATDVCGLMLSRSVPGKAGDRPGFAADGSAYLKLDSRCWRVAVHRGAPGLAYLGLELASLPALEAAHAELERRGVRARRGSPEELAARGVGALAVLADPAGNRVELFASPALDHGFRSPLGAEFLTAGGMGHAVLVVPDLEAALRFYRETLGFARSDFFRGPGISVHFLRCTPRHHSLALIGPAPGSALHHLMFELTSLDGVGQALDRALAAQVPISSTLGRHINDRAVSFYMRSPAGFDVEIGWDAVVCGDDWVENEFAGTGDVWGHHGLTAESIRRDAGV